MLPCLTFSPYKTIKIALFILQHGLILFEETAGFFEAKAKLKHLRQCLNQALNTPDDLDKKALLLSAVQQLMSGLSTESTNRLANYIKSINRNKSSKRPL